MRCRDEAEEKDKRRCHVFDRRRDIVASSRHCGNCEEGETADGEEASTDATDEEASTPPVGASFVDVDEKDDVHAAHMTLFAMLL